MRSRALAMMDNHNDSQSYQINKNRYHKVFQKELAQSNNCVEFERVLHKCDKDEGQLMK